MSGSQPTLIGRLRVRTASQDSLLTQLRVARLLDTVELRSTRLPASATLCLRTAQDPLPGSFRLTQLDIRPPPAWQQAFTAMLDRLAGSAARPAHGAVPAGAQAVVFLDQSELLACLASDWCEGSLTQWWWQSLLKHGSASQIIKELWRKTPEYVPAALDHLAKRNKAGKFVNTFSDGEALSLLTAVARTFSLNALLPVLDTFPNSAPAKQKKEQSVLPGVRKRRSDDARELLTFRGSPWDHWVPENLTSSLGPERQSLVGISLMLQRAPDQVRAPGFAREVGIWRREISFGGATLRKRRGQVEGTTQEGRQLISRHQESHRDAPDRGSASLSEDRRKKSSAYRPRKAADDGPTVAVNDAPKASGGVARDLASVNNPAAPMVQADERVKAPLLDTTSDGLAEDAVAPGKGFVPSLIDDELVGSRDEQASFPAEADTSQSEQRALDEIRTQTQFGGVFYLINLALYLGLYGDFTTPAEPGIALNIWDFVALAARELIGEEFKEDPIWRLLARLAARDEDDEPGSSFEPESQWRLPAEWLKPFSNENAVHWSTDGRLRLLHSSGFLVLDVALEAGNPVEQLERELKAYEGFEFRVSSFEFQTQTLKLNRVSAWEEKLETRNSKLVTRPALATWLGRLLPYFRSRLRLALGLKETEDPASLLCRHTARVCTTGTHLDVFFDLAALPIAIRFAGLDRDPGWVPAAGRFIAFHFE